MATGKVLTIRRVSNGFILSESEPNLPEQSIADSPNSLSQIVEAWGMIHELEEK